MVRFSAGLLYTSSRCEAGWTSRGVHVLIICVISVKYQCLDDRFSRKLQSAQYQRPSNSNRLISNGAALLLIPQFLFFYGVFFPPLVKFH